MPEIATEKQKKPVSFTTLIVLGLASGVLWGLFFGDTTDWTKWIGDIYVGLLQMAEVFRLLLHPNAQQELLELLTTNDSDGASFYWGRFLGLLDQRARDMLAAWGIRTWPRHRIRLLYELRNYVYVDFSRPH